jgi:hypothetical protein
LEPRAYARKYMRIKPALPLYGTAAIVRIGMRSVSSGTTRVRIPDISPAGLRFLSRLRFPADSSVILEISMQLDGLQYNVQGYVARRRFSETGEFEYGFLFLEPNYHLREILKKAFCKISAMQFGNIIILRVK